MPKKNPNKIPDNVTKTGPEHPDPEAMKQLQEIDSLAREILTLSRNTLLVNLRFLDAALSEFVYVPFPCEFAGTDGRCLFYNPIDVLRYYKAEKENVVRNYLHMVMHCIFRHMYGAINMDPEMWDLSCDIAVENAIRDLGVRAAASQREAAEKTWLDKLWNAVGNLTAEKIYRYFQDNPKEFERNKAALQSVFRQDDHAFWYMPPARRKEIASGRGQDPDDQEGEESEKASGEASGKDNGSAAESNSGDKDQEKRWRDISDRMQMDLETYTKNHGDKAGGLIQNLNEVNREKYDYTSFLKKFAVRGEVMKVSPEEFDYVYYTYGLTLYERMPLIEPLEYREAMRIREFVIAIDTSGSVSGDLVQAFVTKTFNILKSTESFFAKINLHIIQCDADIQEHVKITTQEEFDRWIKHMELRGFGGTDFRPVFRLVDELILQKEFTNLKGLIYFTDGYGIFPTRKPDYQAAFVFIRNNYAIPAVPPWAIKLVLEKDDIAGRK